MRNNLRLYLSGKMTGLPNFNHEAFNKKAKALREKGYVVFNPAETDGGSTDKSRSFYMTECIKGMLTCDTLMLLDGWKGSKGVELELAIGEEIGMHIIDENFNNIKDESICMQADYIVSVDRGNDYGPPKEDFTRTGKMWAAILGLSAVSPEQVGMCMIALKLSRLCHKYKFDSNLDIIGYAKTLDIIQRDKKVY